MLATLSLSLQESSLLSIISLLILSRGFILSYMDTLTPFQVGQHVNVLHAAQMPREIVSSTGVIERITHQSSDGTPLYWVSSRRTAVTASQLRALPADNEPSDWMFHDMRCASRQFGSDHGLCNCGILAR